MVQDWAKDSGPFPSFYSQAWDRLISGQFATNECASLLTTVYSDYGEMEIVRGLSDGDNDDAQTFIDVIDQESPRALQVQYRTMIDFYPDLYASLCRH